MADEDREKAEKVAAAKKRYEQLKKQKQKESKKGGAKKKEEKGSTDARSEEAEARSAEESTAEDKVAEAISAEETTAEDKVAEDAVPPTPTRQPSLSMRSKQRSESFRQGAGSVLTPVAPDIKAASGPLSPSLEVQELYRKQAGRIDALEKENKAYQGQQEDGAVRLAKAEEELESLREGSSNMAELKSKASQADRLTAELASVQRQLAQAQQAAKGTNRRVSGTSPDMSQELASKTSTIESLELEISTLRNQANTLSTTLADREASARELSERATTAESATESAKQELSALKLSISIPSNETQAANEDPEALTKRITVLESDLRTAHSSLDAAAKRATSLEQKIEALTRLHRDAASASQAREKELSELRAQLKRRDRPSHVRDASDFDLLDEETETGHLHARIRALEAENFDLRRGVWRDKRAGLQPGMEGGGGQEYEEVDLSGGGGLGSPLRRGSLPRQSSTFQDVISSGISAFTGRPRDPPGRGAAGAAPSPHARKQSLGLLSEDGFDEDAFRVAQEEEAKRRVERVKEIKRGLEGWRGWRVDIVEVRRNGLGGGREAGEVFEV